MTTNQHIASKIECSTCGHTAWWLLVGREAQCFAGHVTVTR